MIGLTSATNTPTLSTMTNNLYRRIHPRHRRNDQAAATANAFYNNLTNPTRDRKITVAEERHVTEANRLHQLQGTST